VRVGARFGAKPDAKLESKSEDCMCGLPIVR